MRTWLLAVLFVLAAWPLSARISTDLDVGYIARLPEIDYVVNSSNPRVEGWPADGSMVTWRAHVRNFSDVPITARYEWLLDGGAIASSTMTFAAGADTPVDLDWPWSFYRHQLTLRVDPDGAIDEESKTNNELTVFTDALAVGFWVEQSLYDHMNEEQHSLPGIGSNSFEDFAQRIIERYNSIAPLAIYPETPNGVLDRWRLQKVVVVPDGSLPLVPVTEPDANANSHPNDSDRTIDLSWGFPASALHTYNDTTSIQYNPFYLNDTIIHELGHARYLLDVYAFSVKHVPPKYQVQIKDNGSSVIGTEMPSTGLIYNGVQGYDVYETWDSGLMVYNYDWIDRYSAAALNLIAGSRAVDGTANEPANYAVFINDLPAQNRVTIRDTSGNPIANASVDLFRGVRTVDDLTDLEAYLTRTVDNTSDMHFTSDSQGRILVGRNPFTAGTPLDGFKLGEMTAILRVKAAGKTQFAFLESRVFNLAYWSGQHDLADHVVYAGIRCPDAFPGIESPSYRANLDGRDVTLKWGYRSNAVGYTVYMSVNGAPPVIVVDHTLNLSTTVHVGGNVWWWVEVDYGVPCPARRSLNGIFTTPPLETPPRRRGSVHQ